MPRLFNSRKGVSLPLETIVLLILAAVVLGALLAFFLGVFTPTQIEVDAAQKQFTICQEIYNKDSVCKSPEAVGIAREKLFGQICKPDRPSCTGNTPEECVRSCCKIFCPVP